MLQVSLVIRKCASSIIVITIVIQARLVFRWLCECAKFMLYVEYPNGSCVPKPFFGGGYETKRPFNIYYTIFNVNTQTHTVESQNEKLCGIHHESCAWNRWTILKHLLLLLYKWIANLLYYRDIFYWMKIQLNQCIKCILLFTCISLALSIIECMSNSGYRCHQWCAEKLFKSMNEWM